MRDELRVTVVATGLGIDNRQKPGEKPTLVHVRHPAPEAQDFDRPTILRNQAAERAKSAGASVEGDMDYLDIPAFLRRQAD